MRIAGFIRQWPTHGKVGGMENHAFSLYTGLAARGHDVHVFTTCHPIRPPTAAESGVTVHYIENCVSGRYSTQYFDFSADLLRSLHWERPFDVVHSESSAARRLCGGPLPVVATWHGLAYCGWRTKVAESGQSAEDLPIPERVRSEIPEIEKYDLSVAVTHLACEDLLRVYGLPPERVRLVLNGMDTGLFRESSELRARCRGQLGIPQDALVIGAAGRLTHDKGHPDLQAILPELLAKHPTLYCLVVGEGGEETAYRRLAHDRIVLAGPQPHSAMPAYFNAMDMLINPTRRYHGLDLVMAEAMLCGVPVVASDAGSVRRTLLGDGRPGAIVPVRDRAALARSIETLATADLRAMGHDAATWARANLSTERMVLEMEQALRDAAGMLPPARVQAPIGKPRPPVGGGDGVAWPQIVGEVAAAASRHLRRHRDEARICLVYFTCGKHFTYLDSSLASLGLICPREIGEVIVYVDPRDPFTAPQRAALRRRVPYPVAFRSTEFPMARSGMQVVANELLAYAEAASSGRHELVAKVDSDVLFLDGAFLSEVLDRSDFTLLGNRYQRGDLPPWAQGGCYFLRCAHLERVFAGPVWDLLARSLIARGYSDPAACPEDAVISDLIRSGGGHVVFLDYQAVAADVPDIDHFLRTPRAGASLLHFEGREKSRMKEALGSLERLRDGHPSNELQKPA